MGRYVIWARAYSTPPVRGVILSYLCIYFTKKRADAGEGRATVAKREAQPTRVVKSRLVEPRGKGQSGKGKGNEPYEIDFFGDS